MVGGGRGSQIRLYSPQRRLRDRYFDLVTGAFDLDAERSRAFPVLSWELEPSRCYADWRARRRGGKASGWDRRRVSIATPNNTHYEITKAALESGLHVVCEKPRCVGGEARIFSVSPQARPYCW